MATPVPSNLCDTWGCSIDIKRSLQLSAVKCLVAARNTHSQPVHTVLRSYLALALFQGAPKDVLGSLRQYADILCIEIVRLFKLPALSCCVRCTAPHERI